MIKFSKKDKIILIIYIIVTILFFVLYSVFSKKSSGNFVTGDEIEEINKINSERTEVKYYLSIEPGEYFDTLTNNATLKVEFDKGIYIFEIRTRNGAQDNDVYRFSGKFDKNINGMHYKDLIHRVSSYEDGGTVNESSIKSKGGEGTIILDGGILYWSDNNIKKMDNTKYNGVFEMPRGAKEK